MAVLVKLFNSLLSLFSSTFLVTRAGRPLTYSQLPVTMKGGW